VICVRLDELRRAPAPGALWSPVPSRSICPSAHAPGARFTPNSIPHHVINCRPAVLQPRNHLCEIKLRVLFPSGRILPAVSCNPGFARSSVPSSRSVASSDHRCRCPLNAVASSSCRLPQPLCCCSTIPLPTTACMPQPPPELSRLHQGASRAACTAFRRFNFTGRVRLLIFKIQSHVALVQFVFQTICFRSADACTRRSILPSTKFGWSRCLLPLPHCFNLQPLPSKAR
jgi:hypothetical protein